MLYITPVEERLFDHLLRYNEELKLGIVYRVAGGWVRDKLMNIESNDIDIAIDKSSGAIFANSFIEYLKRKSERVYGYHVMSLNHEKSKHLETASLKYRGLSIDFVGLRTEEYTNSRIPIIRTGTPEEDANRRDITINALFYNINSRTIEDFTGKGLSDIKEGKIRTPLAPIDTFMDDPLRILRVLRFAARLSFTIAPEILEVLDEEKLHLKLKVSVSKERIGYEIKKTLAHAGYIIGLAPLAEYKITSIIFPEVEISAEEVLRFGEVLLAVENTKKHPSAEIPQDNLYLVRIFALLQNNPGKTKGKTTLTEYVIGEHLRWTRLERKQIVQIEKSVELLDCIVQKPVSWKDKLVRIARGMGKYLTESLTLYDVQQHIRKEIKIDVSKIYRDIIEKGYKNAYLHGNCVSYDILKKTLKIRPKEMGYCIDRCTQLSIIHDTKDVQYILELLSKEMNLQDKKQ